MYFCKFYHLPFRKKEWAMVYDLYHTVQVIVKFYYVTISIAQYPIKFVDTVQEF